jgi:hypothetical protein
MRKLLLVFIACIGLTGVSAAQPIFTFVDINGFTGTMSYNGSTASVNGVAISNVVVSGAPANNGTYLIDGTITAGPCAVSGCGVLNTTTGAQTFGAGPSAFFGPGGSFSLIGSLDTLTGAPILGTQPIILSFAYANTTLFTGSILSLFGSGNDIKSPAFLAFFGITNPNFQFALSSVATPPPGYVANFNPLLPPNPFAGAPIFVGSTFNNVGGASPVAEPSALLLLGTGLLVGAGVLRGKLLG